MTNEEFIESIRLEGEEFRDVVGYDGLYVISNYARIASLRSLRLLIPYKSLRNGKYYYTVRLEKDGITKTTCLHRIVAQAFVPNPNNYTEVDHLDRNGLLNVPSNLRWCTHKMNQNNPKTRSVMSKSHLGVPNVNCRRKVHQIDNGVIVRTYEKISDVELYGFNRTAVLQALRRGYKSGGYSWAYAEPKKSLVNQLSKNACPD